MLEPSKMTREQFFDIALEILNDEKFGPLGALFDYSEDLTTFHVGQWPDPEGDCESRMPLQEFLHKLYIKLGESK